MDGVDEVVSEFLTEAREEVDQLDHDLLAIERDPDDAEALASIFRTVHSIKGTCGFLGFTELERLTHSGENLLGRLRERDLAMTEPIMQSLFDLADGIRTSLDGLEANGSEEGTDHTAMVARLDDLYAQDASEQRRSEMLGQRLVESGAAKPADVADAIRDQLEGDDRRVGELLAERGVDPDAIEAAATEQQQRTGASNGADSSLRVDVNVLDDLMNLVGELVLARNQIVELTKDRSDTEAVEASQRLGLITTELQEGVMKTRMQPISGVWNRFPRVVRDLAKECGKQARVEMEGQETELDKSLLESIKDPLTHLVRNAVDHGIETPAEREAAGKPAEGLVYLRAYHEGGQVNIEITDDGKGIDAATIARTAVEREVISAERAEELSEREALNLIFQPGFSTAAEVTNVSGRGVGMDVVKTNIESIGGSVDLTSTLGQGSTAKLKIPLTLAIIPALIASAGGQSFAIPQVNLDELVRLSGDEARAGVERVHGTPVYRLRGNLLPLVDLRDELDLEPVPTGSGEDDDVLSIVVLQADGHTFGLVVDAISDTQEIVVKPLGRHLRDVDTFAGATILGDGQVALILDVLGLGNRAGLVRDGREARERAEAAATDLGTQSLLVVDVGGERRAAVPLDDVNRLEELDASSVERSGDREVVQYRGRIMPLVRLTEAVRGFGFDDAESGSLHVIVHSRGDAQVGLVVGHITDIVEQPISSIEPASEALLRGTTVVHERVTDVVDVEALLDAFGPPELAGAGAGAPGRELT